MPVLPAYIHITDEVDLLEIALKYFGVFIQFLTAGLDDFLVLLLSQKNRPFISSVAKAEKGRYSNFRVGGLFIVFAVEP